MWRAICKELKWPFIELYNNDKQPIITDQDDDPVDYWMLEPDSDDEDSDSGCYDNVVSSDDDDYAPVLVIVDDN